MKAGFGRASLTPELGRCTGGYSICAPFGQGWWGRLTASALVLHDGVQRVALVAIDLHAGSRWVAERAAEILGWSKHQILLAGTHTHLGPAGIYGNRNYDKKTSRKAAPLAGGSFDRAAAERAARAVADAVGAASGSLRDTTLRVGHAQAWVDQSSPLWNRSAAAVRCQRIPGDPDFASDTDTIAKTDPPRRPTRDAELARWIHGTECPLPNDPSPPTFARSSDPDDATEGLDDAEPEDLEVATRGVLQCAFCHGQEPGGVERTGDRALAWSRVQVLLADGVGALALVPGTPTVLGYTFGLFSSDVIGVVTRTAERLVGTNVGVTTNILGDVNIVSPKKTVDEHLRGRVEGGVDVAMGLALDAGEALGQAVHRAVTGARLLNDPSLEVAVRHVRVAGAKVGAVSLDDAARFGPDTQRGGPLGPGRKGMNPKGPTRRFDPKDPQSPKRPWALGAMPHAPRTLRLQSVRLRDGGQPAVSIFATPAELGTAIGRVLTDALGQSDRHEVMLTGPAGDYLSYADTPMVYRAQAYEGAGIPYGRRTADWLQAQLADLATLHGDDEAPSFDLDEGKPDLALPDGAPIPGAWPAAALVAEAAAGMVVETSDRTWIHGWWTPEDRHEKSGPAPDAAAWLELSWQGGRVDDRSEVLICRLGHGSRSRWFFLAAVAPLSDGTMVSATWKGPSALRPTLPIPAVTVGGKPRAPARSRARLHGDSPDVALVPGVLRVDGKCGAGFGVVTPAGVLTTAVLAEGAETVAGVRVEWRCVHPAWSRWSGHADLGLLRSAPSATLTPPGTLDDPLGLSEVEVVTTDQRWTAAVVHLAHGPTDEDDDARRWGIDRATEFVIRRPPGPLAVGAPVFASHQLVGVVSRATSEHGLANGAHAVVQRLDAWSSFLSSER